jgi:hypothetical protein
MNLPRTRCAGEGELMGCFATYRWKGSMRERGLSMQKAEGSLDFGSTLPCCNNVGREEYGVPPPTCKRLRQAARPQSIRRPAGQLLAPTRCSRRCTLMPAIKVEADGSADVAGTPGLTPSRRPT